jgi:hypothetical protein
MYLTLLRPEVEHGPRWQVSNTQATIGQLAFGLPVVSGHLARHMLAAVAGLASAVQQNAVPAVGAIGELAVRHAADIDIYIRH